MRAEAAAGYGRADDCDTPAQNVTHTAGENDAVILAANGSGAALCNDWSTSDRGSSSNKAGRGVDHDEIAFMEESNGAGCAEHIARNELLLSCGSSADSKNWSTSAWKVRDGDAGYEMYFDETTYKQEDNDTECPEAYDCNKDEN